MTKLPLAGSAKSAFVLAGFLLLGWVPLKAQVPEIEEISPWGAQRGTTIELSFVGQRLDTVRDVLFAKPGIELVQYDSESDDQLTLNLRVDKACPLGEHPFWLVGQGGPSTPRVLQVGPYSIQDEVEPNDTIEEASNKTPLGITLSGIVEGADVDTFRFDLQAGQRLSAAVIAMRLGGAFLDSHLEVLSPNGKVLASMDDSDVTLQDPHLSIVAKQSGPHYLRVRDSAFDGEYRAGYLLHVGTSCQPVLAYPAGGEPGERFTARLIGDSNGESKAEIRVAQQSVGYFNYRHNDGTGGSSLVPVPLRVARLKNILETIGKPTTPGAPPYALNGILSTPGESDRFELDLAEGEAWTVEVFGKRIGSPIDSVLEIVDPEGNIVGINDDSAMHDSELSLTARKSGIHVLTIKDHLGKGGDHYVYRVEVRKPRQTLQLAASTLNGMLPQSPQSITLEPGGRFALLLESTRHGFTGPINLAATGLPEGVRATCEPIASNSHLSQIVFEADSTAAPGAALVGFSGLATVSGSTVDGQLGQTIGLVRGQPRQTVYYGFETDRLPLVVSPSLPFRIEVKQPKASLSQDGLMQLGVIVERKPGFDGSITLKSLKLPPWIERSEDEIRIRSSETTGSFPLICGKRAELETYPVILVASGRVDGMEVECSSKIVQITVDSPYASVAADSASAKQNTAARVRAQVNWKREPEGPVIARLLGLPKFAEAREVLISPSETEVSFEVQIGSETPVALHNTLYVELKIPESGEHRREYHARGSVLEVLSSGAKPQDSRSRLEVLREKNMTQKGS